MSKIYWEFDFDKDGVEEEFKNAKNGALWKFVVADMDNKLRALLKYGNDYKTPDEAIDDIKESLYGFMGNWDVSLW